MAAKQIHPRKNKGMHVIRKIYRILLSDHLRFSNFNANIGNSATSNQHEIIIITNKMKIFIIMDSLVNAIANEIQNKVLAGVGNPINECD